MHIKRVWIYWILLLAAVAALYGQFLWNPILFDDKPFFMLDNYGNQPVSRFHFTLFELRSLPYATLAWTKNWFGLDLIGFRVGNLLLHAAVVLVLFFFLEKTFAVSYTPCDKAVLSPQLAAFFGALLFALHPVATYAAGYLVQRTIIMATLFSLLAMLSYLHGSIRQKSAWLWLSVPFYYLAVFSKEHAIMLPFVLLALTMLLHSDWPAKLKQRWSIFAVLGAIAIFVLLAKKGILGSLYELNALEMLRQNDSEMPYPLSIITQTWLFFKYLGLWLLPNPAWMSVDMREPFARSLLSPYLLAATCYVAWGIGAIWLLLKRGRMGLLGFALLYPWLMFFTEFSTVRIQEVFVLYRSYLWAVGGFCLLPVIFSRLNARISIVILISSALAMMPISMDRLMIFSHSVLLWEDAARLLNRHDELPGAYRIYYNLGTELLKIDELDKGIANLKHSSALGKDFAEAHGNLGAGYFKKGNWQTAIVEFSSAIEMAQKSGIAPHTRFIYGRAQAFEKIGNIQKALADYQESCRLANRGCEKIKPVSLTSPTQLK